VYVEVPVYEDRVYTGYASTGSSDYYLREQIDDNRWKSDKELSQAVFDLEDGFRDNDITLLAGLTDPNAQISVFSKGQYDYSLEPNDYLDMTRDFMREADTADFSVYRVRQKSSNVYQAFARHTYKDRNGDDHTVFLCVVLERVNGRWTMTQVDTSPERLEE
jgi:hypothetical protein